MKIHVKTIERMEAIITLPSAYTNDAIVLYEGSSMQKATVGVAMALSTTDRNQPPGTLVREEMLRALPSQDEIVLRLNHAEDLLELRELVWHALTDITTQ